jgi:hypothetical protein
MTTAESKLRGDAGAGHGPAAKEETRRKKEKKKKKSKTRKKDEKERESRNQEIEHDAAAQDDDGDGDGRREESHHVKRRRKVSDVSGHDDDDNNNNDEDDNGYGDGRVDQGWGASQCGGPNGSSAAQREAQEGEGRGKIPRKEGVGGVGEEEDGSDDGDDAGNSRAKEEVLPDAPDSNNDHDVDDGDGDGDEEKVHEAFEAYYLRQITAEFADELDALRAADDFGDAALPVLITALKQGTHAFSLQEKRAVVFGGRGGAK